MNIDDSLISSFVASVPKYCNSNIWDAESHIAYHSNSDKDPMTCNGECWIPRESHTHRSELQRLYCNLPGRYPPLYEKLLLKYRWSKNDLEIIRLLGNPPGRGFDGLLREIYYDERISSVLIPSGYVQFGKAPDLDYDPICFDMNARQSDGDCRIIRFEHDELLCNGRIGIFREVAKSFRDLLSKIVSGVPPEE
mgnify:CR=1 FL=1